MIPLFRPEAIACYGQNSQPAFARGGAEIRRAFQETGDAWIDEHVFIHQAPTYCGTRKYRLLKLASAKSVRRGARKKP